MTNREILKASLAEAQSLYLNMGGINRGMLRLSPWGGSHQGDVGNLKVENPLNHHGTKGGTGGVKTTTGDGCKDTDGSPPQKN